MEDARDRSGTAKNHKAAARLSYGVDFFAKQLLTSDTSRLP